MTRGIVLFTALFFTALVAGGAFVIWIDYNPTGMSATFYVEKMQHAIRVFTTPLPTIVILSVLSTAGWPFLRGVNALVSTCWLRRVSVPWRLRSLRPLATSPSTISAQWWQFQTARTIAAVCGLALLMLAVLIPRRALGA